MSKPRSRSRVARSTSSIAKRIWIVELATDGLAPDLTLLFDLSIRESAVRTRRRIAAKRTDRLDREKVEFHERVRDAYLEIAQANPNRVRVIDARGSAQETHELVMGIVIPFLEVRGIIGPESVAEIIAPDRIN